MGRIKITRGRDYYFIVVVIASRILFLLSSRDSRPRRLYVRYIHDSHNHGNDDCDARVRYNFLETISRNTSVTVSVV